MIEWIPVTERLPEQGMRCRVAHGRCEVDVAFYNEDEKEGEYGFFDFWDVTHWTPAPAPLHPNELASIALCERNDERAEPVEEKE